MLWTKILWFEWHRFFTRRLVPVVGLCGLNDYHFYWDRKKAHGLFLGLDGYQGEIMEIGTLADLPSRHLTALAGIDQGKTLSGEHAKLLVAEARGLLNNASKND